MGREAVPHANPLGCLSTRSQFDAHLMLSSIASSLDAVCPYRDHVLGRYVAQAIPAYAVDRWQTSAFRPRLDPRSFFAILTCSLSRTLPRLCFGSNYHARRRSSKAFPPAPRLRSPASDFESRAHPAERAEILRRTLRKCFSVGCPGSPRLGSGDLSLRVARDRWARKETT